MHTQTVNKSDAPARVLALLVAANGQIDEPELKMLDSLEAFRRIGVKREFFVQLAKTCIEDIGAELTGHSWLSVAVMDYLDPLLEEVNDPAQRLLVCRLAAAVITADGRISNDERLVYNHALAHWHITQSMVTQAILQDHGH